METADILKKQKQERNVYIERVIYLGFFLTVMALVILILTPNNASAGLQLGTLTVVGKDVDPLHDGYDDQANVTQMVTNDNTILSITYDLYFYINDSSGNNILTKYSLDSIQNAGVTVTWYCDLDTTNTSPIGTYKVTVTIDGSDIMDDYYNEKSFNIQLYPKGRYDPLILSFDGSHISEPGQSITYNFTVKNNGNCPDTIKLSAQSQLNWQTSLNATSIGPLQPGETGQGSLTVTVPTSVSPKTNDQESVRVRSIKNNSQDDVAYFVTQSSPFKSNINFTCDNPNQAVELGSNAVYFFILKNDGKYTDGISISTTAPPSGWTKDISASSITLNPGASTQSVSMTIAAPSTDVSRANIIITVTATSQDGTSKKDIITVTTLLVADLTIQSSDITFSKDNPTAGETVTINANISNIGTKASNHVIVQFFNDTSQMGTQTIDQIFSKEIKNISITWRTYPGVFIIKIKIDPDNRVLEFVETDNEATRTLAVVAPDLTILSNDINFDIANPNEGDTLNISVTVHNSGTSDGTAASVKFLLDNTSLVSPKVIDNISKNGGSGIAVFSWVAIKGDHVFTITLDPDNAIIEINEDNNQASINLHVNARPTTKLETALTTTYVGLSITFSANKSTDSDGSISQYSFDFGDGAASNWDSASTIEHKYTTSGKYTVKLKVKDNGGAESISAATIDVTIKEHVAPAAVTVNKPSSITKTSMTLTWSKNSNDDFSMYEVHMSKIKGFTLSASTLITSIPSQAITSYNVTGLSQGTKYYFHIRVLNTGGQFTDSSELETKTTSSPQTKSPGFQNLAVICAIVGLVFAFKSKRRQE